MENFKFGKILVFSHDNCSCEKQERLELIADQIAMTSNYDIKFVDSMEDFENVVFFDHEVVAVFMEYCKDCKEKFAEVLKKIRTKNKHLPITLFSTTGVNGLSVEQFEDITDTAALYDDTVEFIAGRLVRHAKHYETIIVSPFMKSLVDYAGDYNYAWHTPGHFGGAAYHKNPVGKFFYNYYGEHIFRTDLSISAGDMGSLLDHNGPIGESEKYASKVFGSDITYYVCNGTSSVNQIIWRSRVVAGDLGFVDRNCHKSLNYAMVVTDAIPTYMIPRRNGLGIIGPVRLETFTADYIKKAVAANSLVPADKKNNKIVMSTLTNSTYDGICYNVNKIKETLTGNVENMHFDEAWYSYARFNPIYNEHYGMTEDTDTTPAHPPIYASHSTHKLMAAFSQASMVHVKNGTDVKIDRETFNEAFMMYGSTSPNYPEIASLDCSAKMMDFNGEELIKDIIIGAVELRKEITRLYNEETKKGGWFFQVWQPTYTNYNGKKVDFAEAPTEFLATDQKTWILNNEDKWHGFADLEDDYVMLDPIKITIKMPGRNADGSHEKMGIPAHIVSGYLAKLGVIVEKTDYYSFLVLNSIATTEGQQKALVAGLARFKKLYDENAPLSEVFPELVESYPETYAGVGLKDHCQAMHEYIQESKMMEKLATC